MAYCCGSARTAENFAKTEVVQQQNFYIFYTAHCRIPQYTIQDLPSAVQCTGALYW